MKKIICFILVIILALSFAVIGCGNKNGDDSESESVFIDKDVGLDFVVKRITIYEGDNFQTELEGLDEDETVTYSTYDDEIVEIADNGLIHALSVGFAVVKATSSKGRTALMQVTVNEASMKILPIIDISKSDLNLVVGDSVEVSAQLVYDGKTVSSEMGAFSQNEDVAVYEFAFDDKGKPTGGGVVTAVGEGSTVISFTAIYEGQEISGYLNVTVSEEGLIIYPGYAGAGIYAGGSIELGVAVMVDGEQIEVEDVSYFVSDTEMATLSGSTLTAKNIGGDLTVTAKFNYDGKSYTVESSVHIYGKFKVEIYSRGELNTTLLDKSFGEKIFLELENPVEGREVKAWYVEDERLDGDSFIMEDNDVIVTAVYANDTEDDFSSRFTQSHLFNQSNQATARFVEQITPDGKGNMSSLKGAVMINTANQSSVMYSFDSGVKVTDTAYIKLRAYIPLEATVIYLGISDGDGKNTWLYSDNADIDQENLPAHLVKFVPLEWTEIIIPMSYLTKAGNIIAGFSISVSNGSYCLIDSIELYY